MNKNIIKLFAILMMCFLLGSVLVACGSTNEGEEDIFTVEINKDGYWVINGVVTTVKAAGKDGLNGTPGTPGVNATDCEEHDYNIYDGEHIEANIVAKDGNKWEIKSHAHDCVPSIIEGAGKKATCTEGGYDVLTCDCPRGTLWVCVDCGDAKFQWTEEKTWEGNFTEALGHSYNDVVTAPTCVADGYVTSTCATCGDVQKTAGEAAGEAYHAWGEWGPKIWPEGTCPCTIPNEQNRECQTCGKTDYKTLAPATGHKYTNENWEPCAPDTLTSPCEQVPLRVRYCDNCDCKDHNETVPVPGATEKGHTWGAWEVVTEPTNDTEGLIKRVCADCGATFASGVQEETLPKLDKSKYTYKPLSASNCTEGGKDEYTYVKYPHIVIVVDLEPNGHNYTTGNYENLVKPGYPKTEEEVATCTGSVDVICDVCNEKKNVEVPALTKATGKYIITVGNCLTPYDEYYMPLDVDGYQVFVKFSVKNDSYIHDEQPAREELVKLNGEETYLGYWCTKCEHWVLVEKVED